jgi:hypothetical protein
MRRIAATGAIVCVAAVPAAVAASRAVSYQGYTSQGHQIAFKRSRAGVFSMRIQVRATCVTDAGKKADYDFSLRAIDRKADAVRRGAFMVRLAGEKKTPDATIKGRINRRGVARGTIVATGHVTNPSDIGMCRSGTVHWTAGA